MFEGFTPINIKTQSDPDVTIHGIQGGTSSGPPLLLLHGFPQTHHIWYRIVPHLTSSFNVIALDLRGYGRSSKPTSITSYAKSAMARDCAHIMSTLGHESFYVCAHDRGARVAHKLLVDYPSRVKKAIFLDICPTLAMYTKTDMEFAKAYFHWFFLIQPSPLPETLIGQNPRRWAELFMGGRHAGLKLFEKQVWEEYVSVLETEEAVHAMCEDYRASATIDLEEAREDLRNERRITCPIRVLWAKYGIIEKCFDALKEWSDVVEKGTDVSGHSVECGHYIPEEAPDIVVGNIKDFFV
jgi:pimeloyl-ACP methyl ester carboxylesterase